MRHLRLRHDVHEAMTLICLQKLMTWLKSEGLELSPKLRVQHFGTDKVLDPELYR